MPMPALGVTTAHEELRKVTECQTCGEPSRYVYNEKVWCRSCLDKEQYPHLAQLTQAERDQMRVEASKGESERGIVNTGNLKPKGIGFGME